MDDGNQPSTSLQRVNSRNQSSSVVPAAGNQPTMIGEYREKRDQTRSKLLTSVDNFCSHHL